MQHLFQTLPVWHSGESKISSEPGLTDYGRSIASVVPSQHSFRPRVCLHSVKSSNQRPVTALRFERRPSLLLRYLIIRRLSARKSTSNVITILILVYLVVYSVYPRMTQWVHDLIHDAKKKGTKAGTNTKMRKVGGCEGDDIDENADG